MKKPPLSCQQVGSTHPASCCEINQKTSFLSQNIQETSLISSPGTILFSFYFNRQVSYHFDLDEVVGVLAIDSDDGSVRHPRHEPDGQFVRVRVDRLVRAIQRVVVVNHRLAPLLTELVTLRLCKQIKSKRLKVIHRVVVVNHRLAPLLTEFITFSLCNQTKSKQLEV